VWLRSDAGRIVRSGRCPPYVTDANSAELAAIYAGVFLCLREWPPVRGIRVRSDSQAALFDADPNARLARRPATRQLQTKLRVLLAERPVELSLSWVKGHQPADAGIAAWLNRNCDARAQKLRRRTG
jgi:ribonuclease HI